MSRYMKSAKQKASTDVSSIARKRKSRGLAEFEEVMTEKNVESSPERSKSLVKEERIVGKIKGFHRGRAPLAHRIALEKEKIMEVESFSDCCEDEERGGVDCSIGKDINKMNELDNVGDRRRTERRQATWNKKIFDDGFFYGYWTESEDDEIPTSAKMKKKEIRCSNEIKMKKIGDPEEIKVRSFSDASGVKTKRLPKETTSKSVEPRKSSIYNPSSLSRNSCFSNSTSKIEMNDMKTNIANKKVALVNFHLR